MNATVVRQTEGRNVEKKADIFIGPWAAGRDRLVAAGKILSWEVPGSNSCRC